MSPYRCDDNKLMHEKDGKWSVKQVCKTAASCHRAMGLLYALEKNPKMKVRKE